MCKNRKGFTLIELLIVITIIGILAVAFLPTLLGAPAKGRDTQRIADLQKIQKVMVNADLEGTEYPADNICIVEGELANYAPALGGAVPTDPSPEAFTVDGFPNAPGCAGYIYIANPTGYKFGLYAKLENSANGNVSCADLEDNADSKTKPDNDDDSCYSILVQ